MSDEHRPTGDNIVSPRPAPAGIYEHWCEHPGCTKWGGWGFPRGRETVWFCFEHREDGEPPASQTQPPL